MISVLNEQLVRTWTSPFAFASHENAITADHSSGGRLARFDASDRDELREVARLASKRRRITTSPAPEAAAGRPNPQTRVKSAGPKPLPNPWGFEEDLLQRFPQARQRNFFVIHKHYATAKHFDLRLQCAGSHDHQGRPECERCGVAHAPGEAGTISWALPKGFADWSPSDRRLAVETTLHPIDYSFFESELSGLFGTTMLWDVGTYEMMTSRTSQARGRDHDPETDGEDENDDGRGIGWHHEHALRRAYRERYSITVLLKGARHTVLLSLKIPNDPNQTSFAFSGVTKNVTARKRWLACLSRLQGGEHLNDERTDGPFADGRSILTGRTMDEIQRDMKTNDGRLRKHTKLVRQQASSNERDMTSEEFAALEALQKLKSREVGMYNGGVEKGLAKMIEDSEARNLPQMQHQMARRAGKEVLKEVDSFRPRIDGFARH